MPVPLFHVGLPGSSRGSLRCYNRTEPQKTANIPRRPQRNRVDRNQNVKLPKPSARQPQLSVDKNVCVTVWNRCFNRTCISFMYRQSLGGHTDNYSTQTEENTYDQTCHVILWLSLKNFQDLCILYDSVKQAQGCYNFKFNILCVT